MKTIPLLIVFTFAFSICSVYAIQCWVCNSRLDPKCGDPFDNTTDYLFSCPDRKVGQTVLPATMCRKTRTKVDGNWRTIRSCAYLGKPGEGTGNENHCLRLTGTYDVFTEYCTCDRKDGCNGSQTSHRFIPIFYFLTAISLIVLHQHMKST